MDKPIYSKLVVEALIKKKPLKIDYIPIDLIKFAKINKVLYLLGLYDERIQHFLEWQELEARRKEQRKAMAEVATIAEEHHIDLMVVKTIKPFEYVPDDIDILIINNDTLNTFINKLLRKGYFLRKKGTPEITLRKVIGNTFVDLDIHTKMGAGTYEYIDKYYLWRRRTYTVINDTKIIIPNMIDEFLITVAHAIIKELILIIADTLHVISLNKRMREEALKQAQKIGLYRATKFIINIANKTLSIIPRNLYNHLDTIIYPYHVPMPIITSVYIENIIHRLKVHGITPLKEIVKIPSSKGIAILLRYLGL